MCVRFKMLMFLRIICFYTESLVAFSKTTSLMYLSPSGRAGAPAAVCQPIGSDPSGHKDPAATMGARCWTQSGAFAPDWSQAKPAHGDMQGPEPVPQAQVPTQASRQVRDRSVPTKTPDGIRARHPVLRTTTPSAGTKPGRGTEPSHLFPF